LKDASDPSIGTRMFSFITVLSWTFSRFQRYAAGGRTR